MHDNRRLPFGTILAALALLVLTPPASALEHAERSLVHEETGPGPMRIENLIGTVTIRTGDQEQGVRVEAVVSAEAKTQQQASQLAAAVRLEQRDDTLHVVYPVNDVTRFRPPKAGVKGVLSRWTGSLLRKPLDVEYDGRLVQIATDRKASGLAVHLTITVPIDFELSIAQHVGTIRGRGLRGKLGLEQQDGEIAIERCYGSLDIAADRGTIDLSLFQGDTVNVKAASADLDLLEVRTRSARLHTGSGAIRGSQVVISELVAESVSGNVELKGLESQSSELRTGSGNVDFATRLKSARLTKIRSTSGDVVLRVGKLTAFDLLAETQSGEVKTLGLSLDVIEQDGHVSRLRLGSGGTDVEVTAGSGSLTVRPYDASRMDILVGNI